MTLVLELGEVSNGIKLKTPVNTMFTGSLPMISGGSEMHLVILARRTLPRLLTQVLPILGMRLM